MIDDPLPDEVLVKIAACGLCHSDISIQTGTLPGQFPAILGHEGAGTIVAVGEQVSGLAVGDCVLLSFDFCGGCTICRRGHPATCSSWFDLNFGFKRSSGEGAVGIEVATGHRISGKFFGQSAMAGFALVSPHSCIKIAPGNDLRALAPLGCGVTTGFGAVENVLKPDSDSIIGIWGLGGVGMSSLLAAKHRKVETIIAVDVVPERLALAIELGATHAINGRDKDVKEQIMALTGRRMLTHVVEATGLADCIAMAYDCLGPFGVHGQLGSLSFGSTPRIDLTAGQVLQKTLVCIIEGDANPPAFIPKLVNWVTDGTIPLARFSKQYTLRDFQLAIDAMLDGSVIKPIIVFD